MKSTSATERCYWQLNNAQGFNYLQRKSVQLTGATSERAFALTSAGTVIGQLDELQDFAKDYPPARVA